VFYVLRDGLAAIASMETANLYSTLLPIARALGVDESGIKTLVANAQLADRYDLVTVWALGVVFGGGLLLVAFRYFGWGRSAQAEPPPPR